MERWNEGKTYEHGEGQGRYGMRTEEEMNEANDR